MAVGSAFVIMLGGMTRTGRGSGLQPAVASPSPAASHAAPGSTFHQIFLPDLLVIEPAGLGSGQLEAAVPDQRGTQHGVGRWRCDQARATGLTCSG